MNVTEWPAAEGFFDFAVSDEWKGSAKKAENFTTRPTELHLFETQPRGLEELRQFPLLAITLVSKPGSDLASVRDVVKQKFDQALGQHSIHGISLNLDEKEVVIVEGFADAEVSRFIHRTAYRGTNLTRFKGP
jgi:hypothetical protein